MLSGSIIEVGNVSKRQDETVEENGVTHLNNSMKRLATQIV